MTLSGENELLDLIYGAAAEPALWQQVIARFADAVGGSAGWLSNLNIVDGSGGSLDDPMTRIDPCWPRAYIAHYGQINPLHLVANPIAYQRHWAPKILTDEDWIARDDLRRTEFYNDFLKPQDLGSSLMIRLAKRGLDYATLNIGRAIGNGRFSPAQIALAHDYHPHLMRAFGLANKFSDLRRLNGHLANVLDDSPHGLIVLDADGVVRHANRAAEALLTERETFRVADGRLGLVNTAADRRLQQLVGQAVGAGTRRRTGGTLALGSPSRRLPLSLTVAPLGDARFAAIHAGRTALICITDLDAGVSVPEQRLQALFGLTAAEARLGCALLEGLSPQDAAARFHISRHTVHVQLARIFEKTGTGGQSALVRLMMRTVGYEAAG